MARYRSKPSTCEAEQFIDKGRQVPTEPRGLQSDKDGLFVITAHGQRTAVADGDYIVEEPGGRGFYPVKPDIFEKRWELVPPFYANGEPLVGEARFDPDGNGGIRSSDEFVP